MMIIGFDPSLLKTGYAVLDTGKMKVVSAGQIRTDAKDGLYGRLQEIFTEAGEIIDKHKPEAAVFEESFYHKNVKSANILAQVRSILAVQSKMKGCELYFYSPNTIKKCSTGKGHASKEQVMFMIKRIFSISEDIPDDVSDAIAAAYTFISRRGV